MSTEMREKIEDKRQSTEATKQDNKTNDDKN